MKLKRIDLAAAVAVLARVDVPQWTVRELIEAYTARRFNNGDHTRLRKWTAHLGDQLAWTVTTEQLCAGRDAMMAGGYSVAAVNRDLSAIGSAYRFAQDKRPGWGCRPMACTRGSSHLMRARMTGILTRDRSILLR